MRGRFVLGERIVVRIVPPCTLALFSAWGFPNTYPGRMPWCPQGAFFVPNPSQSIWGRPRDLVFACSGLYLVVRRSERHGCSGVAQDALGQLPAPSPLKT